ncbi:MAG TPA: M48 family metallopeptidase [Anaeromyxobacter sp.]
MNRLRSARSGWLLPLLCAIALSAAPPARGEGAPRPLAPMPPPPAAASGASGALDPSAATRAYLDLLSPERKARSDAYFEGGYWLQLWGFLYAVAVYLLLLATGLSARMRNLAERVGWRWIQPGIYWVLFLTATSVLTLPLAVYQDWWRERRYGLSNLTFGGWMGEQGKALLLGAILGAVAIAVLYAVIRRVQAALWLWASVVAIAFQAFFMVIYPVAVVPVFNHPSRLADERVVRPVLALARANGIGTGDVWEIDASKQTTRVSANVAGFLGTERITLNDNLLNRASLPEIEAIMAHEMGHYVLNHVYKTLLQLALVSGVGFWVVLRAFERLRARRGARWQVRGIADPAGLPLLALVFTAFMFLVTPVLNTIIRVQEQEADLYGLNAAAQPDGFARAALDVSEYRKMEPGPIEEALFYDHPSGRTRIFSAMRWKAEHPETWTRPAGAPPARAGSSDPAAAAP